MAVWPMVGGILLFLFASTWLWKRVKCIQQDFLLTQQILQVKDSEIEAKDCEIKAKDKQLIQQDTAYKELKTEKSVAEGGFFDKNQILQVFSLNINKSNYNYK